MSTTTVRGPIGIRAPHRHSPLATLITSRSHPPTSPSPDQSSPGRTFPFLRLALAIRTTAYAKDTTKNVPANGANMDVSMSVASRFGGAGGCGGNGGGSGGMGGLGGAYTDVVGASVVASASAASSPLVDNASRNPDPVVNRAVADAASDGSQITRNASRAPTFIGTF